MDFLESDKLKQIGLRCARFTHDSRQLACGDSNGNIRIYETDFLEQVSMNFFKDGFVSLIANRLF